jgi:hypothetical protein
MSHVRETTVYAENRMWTTYIRCYDRKPFPKGACMWLGISDQRFITRKSGRFRQFSGHASKAVGRHLRLAYLEVSFITSEHLPSHVSAAV